MTPHSWNESYASGQLPWDTAGPEPLLVEFVTSGAVAPCPTVEIGAGTGTNAIWLAERGFDVLGVDVSPLAVERARAKMGKRTPRCRFAAIDFLASSYMGTAPGKLAGVVDVIHPTGLAPNFLIVGNTITTSNSGVGRS